MNIVINDCAAMCMWPCLNRLPSHVKCIQLSQMFGKFDTIQWSVVRCDFEGCHIKRMTINWKLFEIDVRRLSHLTKLPCLLNFKLTKILFPERMNDDPNWILSFPTLLLIGLARISCSCNLNSSNYICIYTHSSGRSVGGGKGIHVWNGEKRGFAICI